MTSFTPIPTRKKKATWTDFSFSSTKWYKNSKIQLSVYLIKWNHHIYSWYTRKGGAGIVIGSFVRKLASWLFHLGGDWWIFSSVLVFLKIGARALPGQGAGTGASSWRQEKMARKKKKNQQNYQQNVVGACLWKEIENKLIRTCLRELDQPRDCGAHHPHIHLPVSACVSVCVCV